MVYITSEEQEPLIETLNKVKKERMRELKYLGSKLLVWVETELEVSHRLSKRSEINELKVSYGETEVYPLISQPNHC